MLDGQLELTRELAVCYQHQSNHSSSTPESPLSWAVDCAPAAMAPQGGAGHRRREFFQKAASRALLDADTLS